MDKMPCHITDEKVSNDPADAPDAIDKEYIVLLEIHTYAVKAVISDSKESAIELARKDWTREDLDDIEYIDIGVE